MWLLFSSGTRGGTVACGLISGPLSCRTKLPGCLLWAPGTRGEAGVLALLLESVGAGVRQPPAGHSSERCYRCAPGMRGRGRRTPARGARQTSHPRVAVSSLTCGWPSEDRQAPGTIFRSGAGATPFRNAPRQLLWPPPRPSRPRCPGRPWINRHGTSSVCLSDPEGGPAVGPGPGGVWTLLTLGQFAQTH